MAGDKKDDASKEIKVDKPNQSVSEEQQALNVKPKASTNTADKPQKEATVAQADGAGPKTAAKEGKPTDPKKIDVDFKKSVQKVKLPKPFAVSPLIRLARWSLLIAGIFYGAINHARYSDKEKKQREIEAKEKKKRDAKLADIKRRTAENEAKALALLSEKIE